MGERTQHDFLSSLKEEQKRIGRACWLYVLGYVALTAGPYTYLDLFHWDVTGAYVWANFFAWALGYLLTIGLMQKCGYFSGGKAGGVGTYFALGVIMSLAIVPALIVFVLPGLYLLMRWLPVYARVLTNEEWVTQSLGWSWRTTEKYQSALARALVGPILLYGISIAAAFSYEFAVTLPYEAGVLIGNFALSAGSAWLTVLGMASFRELSGRDSRALAKQVIKPA